jgi:hypothetical protein
MCRTSLWALAQSLLGHGKVSYCGVLYFPFGITRGVTRRHIQNAVKEQLVAVSPSQSKRKNRRFP